MNPSLAVVFDYMFFIAKLDRYAFHIMGNRLNKHSHNALTLRIGTPLPVVAALVAASMTLGNDLFWLVLFLFGDQKYVCR
jgi:hypothetical protein